MPYIIKLVLFSFLNIIVIIILQSEKVKEVTNYKYLLMQKKIFNKVTY